MDPILCTVATRDLISGEHTSFVGLAFVLGLCVEIWRDGAPEATRPEVFLSIPDWHKLSRDRQSVTVSRRGKPTKVALV